MRLMIAVGLIWLMSLPAPAADEPGFVPLFNGKDLSGWVPVNVAPKTFTAREGMIVSTGLPTGTLRTDRMYENFIIELEWRHMKPGGNAGLFIWGDPITAVSGPFSRGIEVQILDGRETATYTSHGDIFSIWGAKMTPDRPHPGGAERCLAANCTVVGGHTVRDAEIKFGLSVTLASQGLAELDERTRATVRNSVHTLLTFRLGDEDADILAPEFDRPHQDFNPFVLRQLEIGHAMLRIPGRYGEMVITAPPPELTGRQDVVRKQSRIHYGNARANVEEKIQRALHLA